MIKWPLESVHLSPSAISCLPGGSFLNLLGVTFVAYKMLSFYTLTPLLESLRWLKQMTQGKTRGNDSVHGIHCQWCLAEVQLQGQRMTEPGLCLVAPDPVPWRWQSNVSAGALGKTKCV